MRDAKTSSLTVGSLVKWIVDIPVALTRPSALITEGGLRRRARFLRIAILIAVCVFPIIQITSGPTQGYPVFSLLTIYAAGVYLLSGTQHIRMASALSIVCTSSLPFIAFLVYPTWGMGTLAFQILTWPILSVLLGTQLTSLREQSMLVGGLSIALLVASILHPGIIIGNAIELIVVFFGIAVLLVLTSWNQDYYSKQLERSNKALDARRRELEIYTSLLRHDLSNDLQMILGGIELSQMANGEPRQTAFLESTHAAAQRMRSLLHIFSMSEVEMDTDIVTVLEKIGKRAEIAFKGMHVLINTADEVRQNPPKYGRLVALAFENLLRNSSQHAGDDSSVEITISQTVNTLEILFRDDGPGIDPSIRENLFERGVSTGSEGKGLGLYLTRRIIESENGSIELVDQEKQGCSFRIRLPFEK